MGPIEISVYLETTDDKMAHHIIVVPNHVAEQFIDGKGAPRVLCRVENGEEFPCAINPRHGRYVIIASLQLIRRNKLETGLPFTISLRTDPSNGLALPEELAEVLLQDEFGSRVYESLGDGHKRGLIHYVSQPKSVDSRIKRSLEIVEKIKQRFGAGK